MTLTSATSSSVSQYSNKQGALFIVQERVTLREVRYWLQMFVQVLTSTYTLSNGSHTESIGEVNGSDCRQVIWWSHQACAIVGVLQCTGGQNYEYFFVNYVLVPQL